MGGCPKINEDESIEDACKLAMNADIVILVCGLSPEWESEGFDRPTMSLPGRQNELIARVAGANPKTVVCVQAV